MRELAMACLLLLALVVAALAPTIWGEQARDEALASRSPSVHATPHASAGAAATFPTTDRPLELVLPAACRILTQGRHSDGLGVTWTVQCGSATANLSVAVAAMRQGWSHMQGPPIGVGMQTL